MNRCGVSSAARYQCTRNHNYDVTFVCQTALQSQFFTQTVEIISRSDLFNQLRHNAFAQYQLMSRFSLVVSAVMVASGKYLRTARADLPPGSNHDQRSIQFFSSFNGTTAYRFGNAQFTVVIVELETAVHHAVGNVRRWSP